MEDTITCRMELIVRVAMRSNKFQEGELPVIFHNTFLRRRSVHVTGVFGNSELWKE
jgi:hypothetical protein